MVPFPNPQSPISNPFNGDLMMLFFLLFLVPLPTPKAYKKPVIF
jgi:hypothetical protein